MGSKSIRWILVRLILLLPLVVENVMTETANNFCQGVQHVSHFEYTCCNGSMLDVGIDFQLKWKECAIEPGNDTIEASAQQTMWRIYNCIVKSTLGVKTINLVNFATAMTAHYPKEVKRKIMEVIETTNLDVSGDSALNLVRVTYHSIEQGVCLGNYVPEDITVLSSCKDGKDILRSNQHFRGDCCKGEQLPIPLTYMRREASEILQVCTKKLVVAAGRLSVTLMQDDEPYTDDDVETYEFEGFFNQSDMRQVCLQSCILKSNLNIIFKPFSSDPFDFETTAKLLVDIFPKSLNSVVMKFIKVTRMRMEVDDFIHENMDNLLRAEYNARQTNRTSVRRLLTTCESHNLLVRNIEMSLMEMCRGSSEPESEPEPEAEPTPEPEPEAESSPEPEPESSPEPEAETTDQHVSEK